MTHPIAGPSTATEPDFPAQNTMTLEKAMEELRQGNILPEMEKMGTLFVKSNKLLSGWQNSPALNRRKGNLNNSYGCNTGFSFNF